MATLDLVDRLQLGDRLRRRRASVAHTVTTDFLKRHPDFAARYGDRGYQRGVEDAAYHVDFLAAAAEAGSATLFGDYLRWTVRVLSARGIGPELVVENVHQMLLSVLDEERGSAASLLRQIRDEALVRLAEPESPANVEGDAGFAALRGLFIDAALRGERKAAFQIGLDALQQKLDDSAELYIELFQRTMYEIGRRWERNLITVAQEHMATATLQYVVSQLYSRLPMKPATRGKALITGVEGEHHQLGANLVADVLEMAGFDVQFLGSDVPAAAVMRAVEQEQPTLIGISTTMAFNLPKAIALVHQLQSGRAAGASRIIVGGAAFAASPRLVEELGVLGVGLDVRGALALACGE